MTYPKRQFPAYESSQRIPFNTGVIVQSVVTGGDWLQAGRLGVDSRKGQSPERRFSLLPTWGTYKGQSSFYGDATAGSMNILVPTLSKDKHSRTGKYEKRKQANSIEQIPS
jgi:hypothetical protein